jgi:ankyrin repeat protein
MTAALFTAIKEQDVTALRILLELEGFDINAYDNKGETLLHRAFEKSNPEIVTMLLDNGADVKIMNKMGMRSLHTGFIFGSTEMFELLEDLIVKKDIAKEDEIAKLKQENLKLKLELEKYKLDN